ncbi:uncharacterized protein LOC126815141 [Patella vulgata]|uniref:uncharacterized protein LOC126815141 n=1 Tax=Patella vulgata TaxID=6465 RepID=UPI00217F97CC|nr:uncharacterized protein LOC126815141 [Patella vulgata]
MNRNLLHLKTVKQQRTMVEITDLWVQNNHINDKYWIGGFNYVNTSNPGLDGWYWDDCTPIGEPSHWASSAHDDSKKKCVFRSKHGETWFTDRCDNQFQYICQINIGECWFEDRKSRKLIDDTGSGQVVINKSPRSLADCKEYCQDYDDPDEDCTSFTNKDNECLIILGPYTSNTFQPIMHSVPNYTTFIKRCYTANVGGEAATDDIRGFVEQYYPEPLCRPKATTANTPAATPPPTTASPETTAVSLAVADTTNNAESTIEDTTTTVESTTIYTPTTIDSTTEHTATSDESTFVEATTTAELTTVEAVDSTTEDTTTNNTADTKTTMESTSYGTTTHAESQENTDSPPTSKILILPVNNDTISSNLTSEPSSNQTAGITGISGRPLCRCRCRRNGSRLSLENILSYLSIDEKVLSANVRRKISISDERPSAVALGILGITLLVAAISLFIISDTTSFIFNRGFH